MAPPSTTTKDRTMNPMNILAAALLGAAALPASAAQFDFYKLGNGGGDFLATNGQTCTGGDWCSSNVNGNVFNGNLSFSDGGITAVATGTYNAAAAAVVQDHQNGWTATSSAGLGVYHAGVEWKWWQGPQDCSGAIESFGLVRRQSGVRAQYSRLPPCNDSRALHRRPSHVRLHRLSCLGLAAGDSLPHGSALSPRLKHARPSAPSQARPSNSASFL